MSSLKASVKMTIITTVWFCVPLVSITVLFSAGLDRGDFMMKILFIVYIMINFPLPAVLILESTIYQV